MPDWLQMQRHALKSALMNIRCKNDLVVTQPFFRVDGEIPGVRALYADDNHFRQDPGFAADIFFNQGYAPDRARLRYVRGTQRAGLHATWFWDNHHLYADTTKAALLSDVYFYAHGYRSDYIRNSFSLDGGFVPLCPIFWQMNEVEEAATRSMLAPRSNLLYGGYNSYSEFPDRDVLIERIKSHIPDNNLFVTPHGTPSDQHPFYGMTPVDRLLEWMRYKVSLCISFGGNTAIRIFDMLLGGGIPLVLGRPADLDAIIPRHMQEMLPVIVIDDNSPEVIAAAHLACIARFDEGGNHGVMTRHMYIKHSHMPHHRLGQMIESIRALAERVDEIDTMLAD